ncbi:MAG: hypothetical protein PHO37_17865 [Kiritimatiellae bacterium]|nr:hypothetical protein [Kiritimatiellia bacterium]
MAAKKRATIEKQVKTLTHDDAARKNILTVEYQAMIEKEQADPLRVGLMSAAIKTLIHSLSGAARIAINGTLKSLSYTLKTRSKGQNQGVLCLKLF